MHVIQSKRDALGRLPPLRRPFVKLVVPSAGLFGLYLGGLLGVFLTTFSEAPPSWLKVCLATSLCSSALAFASMTVVDAYIGEAASHVDILQTLFYMCAAAAAVMIERLLGERVNWALPQFLENLTIWSAGVASIWNCEPGFSNWKTALKDLARPFKGPE